MKTDSTFWTNLGAEIDQYKKRAKINLQNYEKQRFNNLYNKKKQKTLKTSQSLQQNNLKLGYSMNLIRQWKRDQIQKTQLLKSRFNYIKTQRDRKIQSSQRIRNKLDKVMSIRSISTHEKFFFQNQINQFKTKTYIRKKQLTQRAKSQRRNIQQQRQKLLSQNFSKGKQVREESLLNEETILQQKTADLTKRKKAVEVGQKQYQKCLQNKKSRQQKTILLGKQNHFNHIHQQYLKYEKVKKLNQSFMSHFRKQSKRIILEADQAHKNLINFQTMLMLRKKPKEQKVNQSNSKDKETQTNYSQINNSLMKQKQNKKFNNFFHLTN